MDKSLVRALGMLGCIGFTGLSAYGEESKPWKEVMETSFVQTQGNSDSMSISAKNTFICDWTKLSLEITAGALGSQNGSGVVAEQYNASEKISLKLSGKNYAYEKISWEKNRFAGIKDKYDSSVGLGRNLLDLPKDKLSLELGAGYNIEDRINAENKNYASGRGYTKFEHKVNDMTNASQDFEYLADFTDSKNYRINTETAFITSISKYFSLKTSYLVKYVNTPVVTFERTDTTTSVVLILNY